MHRFILSCFGVLLILTASSSTSLAKHLSGEASYRPVTDADIVYLLNRLSFGAKPGDVQAVKAVGIAAYINQQLHPLTIPESPQVNSFKNANPVFTMSPAELFTNYGPPAVKAATAGSNNADDKKEAQKVVHKMAHEVYHDNAQLHIIRALYSPRQLQEVMTDFWFNHFNISADKGFDRFWVGNYEENAIRPYALGKFRDLLGATCHHAAMLFYLDNWENSGSGNANGNSKFKGLNENYARELMELHTLGVDGGYTQQDVIQLAKILTGLGLPPQNKRALEVVSSPLLNAAMGYYFDEKRHDFSNKVLLGHAINGTGANEIERALDILARSPATAHHISYQLAQYFVCDNPPESLVRRLTARYMQTDGDIKALLADVFSSNEFWDPRYRHAKYKNPFRYAISVLRATNAQPASVDPIIAFLKQQGMAIYGCLTPDGYKNTKDAWLNPDTLLKRIGFATSIASGHMARVCPQPPDYTVVGTIFSNTLSANTVQVIQKAPPQLKLALLLGSPEFMLY